MTNNHPTYAEIEEQSRARIANAKPLLLSALKALGAAVAIVEYDGYGDSGMILSVSATTAGGEPVDLTGPAAEPSGEGPAKALADVLEEFAWEALGYYHVGYQDNEGGFGTLTIDVGQGSFKFDHNARFVDVETSATEF